MRLIPVCFFLLFRLTDSLQAQEDIIHFFNVTREDGLAQATVTGMLEGSDGFVWIATAEGLHRYDGYEFRIFKNNLRDSTSLSSNHVTAICEQSARELWVGTYHGELNLLDKKDGKCQRIRPTDHEGQPNAYPLTVLWKHPDGSLYIGLDGGGMLIKRADGSWINLHSGNSALPNNYVKSFNEDTRFGGVWVSTAQGIALLKNGKFSRPGVLALFDNQYVTDIETTGPDRYISTAGQGLFRWDVATHLIEQVETPRFRGGRFVNFVMRDPKGDIWAGTEGGGVIRIHNGDIHRYMQDPFNKRSLVSDHVVSGMCDSRGMVWLGCINGFSRFDPNFQLFRLYRSFEWEGKATNNNIYCIYEDHAGIIWLGTLSGGLVRFDPKTGKSTVYPVLKAGSVETRAVRSVYEDSRGTLWVGSRDEGLFSFDRTTGRFHHHPPKGDINIKTIRCITEDSDGYLWLGSNWGLIRYSPQLSTFEVYVTRFQKNNPIYQIIEDRDRKELILCTFRSGLHIFHKDREAFTVLQHNADTNSPSVDALMCIEAIGKDEYLIGTYGGGINHFNRKTLSFRALTNVNGLPNNVVYGILRQNDNTFWLSTNDGIVRYRVKEQAFRRFGLNYYLQGLEFNEGAYCRSRNGTCYFGGTEGFNSFNPESFPAGVHSTAVRLTGCKTLNEHFEPDLHDNNPATIELDYNENLITLTFAALNFNPENNYAYKLQGYDDHWIYTGRDRAAYYTRLSPGNYLFKIKVANEDGLFGPETDALRIRIQPPFWKTWWFFSFLALLLAALVFTIVVVRTRAVSRAYKHRVLELEMRALRSQMNPHFIFNSLNSIQYFVLKNEPRQAYNYLTKFSSLMRMILQNSRKRFISLASECDWLHTYLELEKLRMEEEMDFKIDLDPGLDPEQYYVPSMLLQPYVENAILHGLLPKSGDRSLSISFSLRNDHLQCVILDNGIGRKKSRELNEKRSSKHQSQGLELTGERLDMLQIRGKTKASCTIRDLYDSNGMACGTEVILLLPVVRTNDLAS